MSVTRLRGPMTSVLRSTLGLPLIFLAALALACPAGAQPTLLGMFGEWGAYTAAPGGKKICFALAKPAKSETAPAHRPRDAAYLFVSSRPAEKVKDEVSIIIGYGFKPNTEATLELGGA